MMPLISQNPHLDSAFQIELIQSPMPVTYLSAAQEILDNLILEHFQLDTYPLKESQEIDELFEKIRSSIPILQISPPALESNFNTQSRKDDLSGFSITCLLPNAFTQGAGKYVAEMMSRWLIPGKQILIVGQIALAFRFLRRPEHSFFIFQQLISLDSREELKVAYEKLPSLLKDMQTSIMAVYRARYLASLKSYLPEHKNLLIEESLHSLFKKSDQSLFDAMHGIITKLSAEEKLEEVKKNLNYLVCSRPKVFDRDIFTEIISFTKLLTSSFASKKNPRYLSRIIAYHYLFKKILEEKTTQFPDERHFSLKLIHNASHAKEPVPILAFLIGMNFLKETERFDFKHLSEVIKTCNPNCLILKESYLTERQNQKFLFLYFEISKKDSSSFSFKEMRYFQEKLPTELKKQIEIVAHPIFMPRNEEELLRNLIVLSKEIKYLRDLPQVSIHYEKQTDENLSFTVLLARIYTKKSLSISQMAEQSQNEIKIDIDHIRTSSKLKKRHPIETVILRATLPKTPFFRPDYSIDLLRARQKIVQDLYQRIGEFRDFNGGIIIQQERAIGSLRNALLPMSPYYEMLLENYFYSLRPAVMQTIHDTSTLAIHFTLLLDLEKTPFNHRSYVLHEQTLDRFYIGWIQCIAPGFKEEVLKVTGLPSHELTISFLQIDQISALGFILKISSLETVELFHQKLLKALTSWETHFACPIQST